jgi:lysophospholipase L1-like esterase
LLLLACLLGVLPFADARADEPSPLDLVTNSRRILFLGDSITYGGDYIAAFDAWLTTKRLKSAPVVIGCGLPSETVSGLSEEGHAGGKFPRPVLSERLDRVLTVVEPDLVFACYGINCGIYEPLDEARFAKYREGFTALRDRVIKTGARFVAVTPPFYDDLRAPKKFSYNGVLDKYSDWLIGCRTEGWTVIDLHHAMTAEVLRRRETNPTFTFQPDGVHPNAEGQWYVASRLIAWCGDEEGAKAKDAESLMAAKGASPELLKLCRERFALRRDAYVGAAGHLRPGVGKGLPLPEAEAKAKELTARIADVLAAKK